MFKISLPVQRFVIGCFLLMILIVIGNYICNELWIWQDNVLDSIFQSGPISI